MLIGHKNKHVCFERKYRDYIFIQDNIVTNENLSFLYMVGLFNIIILICTHLFEYEFIISTSESREHFREKTVWENVFTSLTLKPS